MRASSIVPLTTLLFAAFMSSSAVWGQADLLIEPFPRQFDLRGIDGRVGFRVEGTRSGVGQPFLGSSVSGAGDVNGDGIADLLISSGALDGDAHRTDAGPSYVVFGRESGAAGFPEFISTTDIDGSNGFGLSAYGTSSLSTVGPAGDVNGDGVDDIVASTWLRDVGRVTYVLFGRDTASQGAFSPRIEPTDINGENGFRIVFSGSTLSRARPWTVRGIGDLNADGVDDFAIGMPHEGNDSHPDVGATFVVFGRNTSEGSRFPDELELDTLDGTDGFRFDGTTPRELSGAALSSAGDLNGDGLPDVLVGSPNAKPDGEPGGNVYVLFGRNVTALGPFPARFSVAWIDTTNGFIISGGGDGGGIGLAVSRAGDINADGFDDIIIGAPNACPCSGSSSWNTTGAAFIVYGRDTASVGRFPYRLGVNDLDGAWGFRFQGEDVDDQAGFTVGGGGDVNGDGVDDIVIGANRVDYRGVSYYGSSYVVFGRDTSWVDPFPSVFQLSGLYGKNGFRAEVIAMRDHARVAAIAGDINADGQDDVLIGAMRVKASTSSDWGVAYVIYGRDLEPCYADIDEDGELTIFDFLAFGSLFDQRDKRGDFDRDGEYTFFDFLAFQTAFQAGCP